MNPEEQPLVGLHAVESAVRQRPQQIRQLFLQQQRQDQRYQALLALAREQRVIVTLLEHRAFHRKLTDLGLSEQRHQGVIALLQAIEPVSEETLFELVATAPQPLLLILDGVTDPHNLGACLRTADAAGVLAVIIPKHRAAGLTATVAKVASGAAESVPLVSVTNLARTLRALQEIGIGLIGTTGEATDSLYDADLRRPVALIMGAEDKGIRRLTREHCDQLVQLPMHGHVSSLNVSVAAGVCLFEAVRQRRNG